MECLIFLGVYQSNVGKPRSAWLCYRRALNIAQLLGIHRRSTRDLKATEELPSHYMREIWCCILGADCYLSLLLGLSLGIAVEHCDLEIDDDEAKLDTAEQVYSRRLIIVASKLIDRNQSSKSPSYITTNEIDERLEFLARELPASWWELPSEVSNDRTNDAGIAFDKAVSCIWHYQLVAFLHLPFMLRAGTEPRFEYSKCTCLNASREMLRWYVVLRKGNKSFSCKVIDFQIFTAAVTLLLALGSEEYRQKQHLSDDWQLIYTVIGIMESLARYAGEAIAAQGVKVLKALQLIIQNNEGKSGTITMKIPYFGIVKISTKSYSGEQNRSLDPPDIANEHSGFYASLDTSEIVNEAQDNFPLVSFQDDPDSLGLENYSYWEEWSIEELQGSVFCDLDEGMAGNSSLFQ